MDTNKLELLLKTVDCGSMKKASDKLNYTQSGLVYTLNSLEKDLGLSLMKRSHKGVALSNEGKRLEPFIRNIVENVHLLEKEIQRIKDLDSLTLKVGAYPAISKLWMPSVISSFKEIYPNFQVSLYVGMEEMHDMVQSGELDLAFCEIGISKGLTWTYLTDDEIYVAVPHPSPFKGRAALSLKELEEYTVLMPSHNPHSSGNASIRKWLECNPQIRNLTVKAPDVSTQLAMVGEGLGITFVSKLYTYECPLTAEMYPLEPKLRRQIGCITDAGVSPVLKKFIHTVKDYLDIEET